jgi:hypothetical protein
VYIFTLLGDVKKVVETLRNRCGDYKLAMLYNSDLEAATNWNLIVSSEWTDDLGVPESIKVIAKAVHESLGLENKGAISRITVLKTNDPFVTEMTHIYPVHGGHGGVPLHQVTSGGVTEGAGFVLYSQPEIPAWSYFCPGSPSPSRIDRA